MALGKILKKATEGASVVDLINKAVAENKKMAPMQHDDWIRVSSIGTLCPREEVICSLKDIVRTEHLAGKVIVNFAMGEAVHWLMQNRALPKTGILIGSWRCTWCGLVYGSRKFKMVPRPERCYRCGASAQRESRSNGRPDTSFQGDAFVFAEEWIGNEEHRIGGSPDGQLCFGDPDNYRVEDLCLLEFKSCNERNFVKFKNVPDWVHIIQAQIYLWLAGYKTGKIIYYNKNGLGTDGIVEHDIKYDVEMIERILAAVATIRQGISTKTVPKRTVCAHGGCERAKLCQVSMTCFSNPEESFKFDENHSDRPVAG